MQFIAIDLSNIYRHFEANDTIISIVLRFICSPWARAHYMQTVVTDLNATSASTAVYATRFGGFIQFAMPDAAELAVGTISFPLDEHSYILLGAVYKMQRVDHAALFWIRLLVGTHGHTCPPNELTRESGNNLLAPPSPSPSFLTRRLSRKILRRRFVPARSALGER